MRAAFEAFNKLDKETRMRSQIISMDVKALYPSMSWQEITTAVKEMIVNSNMDILNIDWMEVGKYLAVVMTEEQIAAEGLTNVVPKRRGLRLRKITINYLQQKKNADKWLPARKPGVRQKRKMLALAIAHGVQTTLSSHTYKVGDEIFLQMAGGPIGLELTGALSRPFMLRWDKLYLKKVKKAGVDMKLYERYADDSNQVAIAPPPGAIYSKQHQKVLIDENLALHDDDEEKRVATVLKDIANDVMDDVQMEEDYPGKNEDKKLAILDMKVWIDKTEVFIMFEHFEKPMKTKKIMHAQSAISASCKRSVHTQEVVRRLLNSSTRLDWSLEVAPVISQYMARMMQAGYPEQYQKHTLSRAIRIYDKMLEDDRRDIRPLYRPKDWQVVDRRNEKDRKKHNWSSKGGHIAPIFVPPTPDGELAKMLRQIAENEAEAGINFRIVETGGCSVKSKVQKSNPTAMTGCDDVDCLPCKTGSGDGGNCRSCGTNYQIGCALCPAGQSL